MMIAMSWSQAGDDRWKIEGPSRHLLLHDGRWYLELHGGYLHPYTGPEQVPDPAWPMGNPATMNEGDAWPTEHVLTKSYTEAESVPDDEIWAWMAAQQREVTDELGRTK